MDLIIIFLGGLRFDLTAVLYLNSLYCLTYLLPMNFKNHLKVQKAFMILFLITNGIGVAMNLADTIYSRFTSQRATFAITREFENETNFVSLIGNWLVDYYYMVIIFVALIGLAYFLYQRTIIAVKCLTGWKDYVTGMVIYLVFIALSIIGIRSGLPPKQDFPLAPSDAGQYVRNPKDIVLVQNTPFSVMRTSSRKVLYPLDYFSPSKLDSIYNPVHQPVESGRSFKPLNVVVFIVESLGREPLGCFNRSLDGGKYKGYTPFLDSLAQHSLIFVNSFANSRRSIEGSPAVLASIPSLEGSFTLSNYADNDITSLPNELKSKGYSTAFFHGAPNGSMGLSAFANKAGIEKYFGKNEYGNDGDFDGVWGIWDHLFLPYTVNIMDKLPKPFFSAIFTVSSHDPYKIPPRLKGQIPEGKIKMHRSIGYADYALKQFFRRAQHTSWFDSTLFVITGDHTCTPYFPRYHTSVVVYTVPIIFYQPHSKLVGVDSLTAQQIDIMPTVLGYLGYDHPYFSFGQNLLTPTKSKFAINYIGNAFQLIKGDWVLIYDLKKIIGFYNIKDDPLMENNLSGSASEIKDQMFDLVRAVIQQFNNRMIDNRLTLRH